MGTVPAVAVFGPLRQHFSDAYMSPSGLPNVGWVLTGSMIMLTIMFEPRGLYGVWLRIEDGVRWLRRRGASDGPAAGTG
jgi:ABC-type branched-subunit amino acid transport system permease subunit